jgi:hypothetical protein
MGFQMFLRFSFVFYGDKGINKIMYNFVFLPFNFRNLILNFKMLDIIWFCNIRLLSTIYYNYMNFKVILCCVHFSVPQMLNMDMIVHLHRFMTYVRIQSC